ncbi:MAG: LCP family protein [Clostridia bacterium]|nr:LCP family protein [Clostridia bacterium]
MKKIIALFCVLFLLLSAFPGRAETVLVWSVGEWSQVTELLSSDKPALVPDSYKITLKQSQVYLADANEKRSGWLNIALISSDAANMRANYGRSEALLVCRINQNTGEFRLLSLPEYMKVQLKGLPEEIQLKYVNCFGGPLLAIDTINRQLGLSVNRYCAINVDSFSGIIDSLGGVELTLTESEAEALGLQKGVHVLSGTEAVSYLKLRRQWDGALRFRILMEALLRQMSTKGMISGALSLVDTMLHMIDTNLTMDEIVVFAFALLEQQEVKGIESYRLEADAEGHVDEAACQACRDFLYGGASGK